MPAPGPLRNGVARLYYFPKGVHHVAWAWMQNHTEIYSSWEPKKDGKRERLGTAIVPMPGGGERPLVISLMEANRNPSLREDTERFGTPDFVDLPGLHLTWMERYHRFAYKLGSEESVPMQDYLLGSVQIEGSSARAVRFNCVIHCMRLFRAGLIGVRLPEQFNQDHSAALGLHWRKPEEVTAENPAPFTIHGPFKAHSAYGDLIQARQVFDLVKGFQAQR